MERFVIDTGIFILGVSIGYLIGSQIAEKTGTIKTAETIEPVNTSTAEPAKPAKKKKKVVLTPSVA